MLFDLPHSYPWDHAYRRRLELNQTYEREPEKENYHYLEGTSTSYFRGLMGEARPTGPPSSVPTGRDDGDSD